MFQGSQLVEMLAMLSGLIAIPLNTNTDKLILFLFFHQRLMSELEVKEKDLNKLKHKVDILLKNNHPDSDKIEVMSHS